MLLVENGKLGPEEIRKHWGEGHVGCGWEQYHGTHGCAEKGIQGGQKGLELLLDIQNQFLQRSKQFGPKLR